MESKGIRQERPARRARQGGVRYETHESAPLAQVPPTQGDRERHFVTPPVLRNATAPTRSSQSRAGFQQSNFLLDARRPARLHSPHLFPRAPVGGAHRQARSPFLSASAKGA